MNPLHITETIIRQHSTAESFSRGQEYERRSAVLSLIIRGDLLHSQVMGNEEMPYFVQVTLGSGNVIDATCSCPYEWGGWCKHIIATLLTAMHHPERIEYRPLLQEQLAAVDATQLRDLLVRLVSDDPALIDTIELQLGLLQAEKQRRVQPKGVGSTGTALDSASLHRQVRTLISVPRRGQHGDDEFISLDRLTSLLSQVSRLNAIGDGRNAALILEAILDELINHIELLPYEEGYELFTTLNTATAMALLAGDFTRAELNRWIAQLESWQTEIDDYGFDSSFEMAIAAAAQGWDNPLIRQTLKGRIQQTGVWQSTPPDFADRLARLRLAILDQQGRYQEFLNLAEAEGQIDQYLVMLVRMGRSKQAVEEGLRYLETATDAQVLAQTLESHQQHQAALQIAKHGLSLAEPRAPLATWLTSAATDMPELALHAAQIAFRSAPNLNSYQQLVKQAGPNWKTLGPTTLDWLRKQSFRGTSLDAAVEIFLHERLIDDAIRAVKEPAPDHLLQQVMDVAISKRPSWVSRTATARAEQIIEAGDAAHYNEAIAWLRRARDAHRINGKPNEWHTYLTEIRHAHSRKYKLMELLEQL